MEVSLAIDRILKWMSRPPSLYCAERHLLVSLMPGVKVGLPGQSVAQVCSAKVIIALVGNICACLSLSFRDRCRYLLSQFRAPQKAEYCVPLRHSLNTVQEGSKDSKALASHLEDESVEIGSEMRTTYLTAPPHK